MTRTPSAFRLLGMTGTEALRRSTSEDIADACTRLAADRRFRVTMSDLCDVSGVSERRVRSAFHECHGTSPTAYLRTAALWAVRHVLLQGGPDRDAVTRTAYDHGFQHLSRFAGHYRALFGEPPSVTVARARSLPNGDSAAQEHLPLSVATTIGGTP